MPANLISLSENLYCKPGVSTKYKTKIGLIAVKNIPVNTKVIDLPIYQGRWCYTKDLLEKHALSMEEINLLQDLYKNKKLFMNNKNKIYTFLPTIPIHQYHAEMFLNSSSKGNVVLTPKGYVTIKNIDKGEEILVV